LIRIALSLIPNELKLYDTFKIKKAAYPDRIYSGNIDSSKVSTSSLDFFDVFENKPQGIIVKKKEQQSII